MPPLVVFLDFLFPGAEQDMVLDITEAMLEDLLNYTKLKTICNPTRVIKLNPSSPHCVTFYLKH